MAGKARRAAARQSELSRRRKKSQRGPSGIPSAAPRSPQPTGGNSAALAVEGAAAISGAATAAVAEPVQDSSAAEPAAPRPAQQVRSRGRTRGERPTAYNYVGSEVRRIAALTSVAVAALVALSFVI